LESFGYKDFAPNGAAAIAIRHDRDEAIIQHRALSRRNTVKPEGLEVVGGFLPRVFIYGVIPHMPVIGMKLFQLAGEMGSTGASPVVRRALAANPMACVRAAAGYPFVSILRTAPFSFPFCLGRSDIFLNFLELSL
jgi:hypothetical protein